MPEFLVVTVRFLGAAPTFHGRRDVGEPEWPPSPLRLFQALVASAAARWRPAQFQEYAAPALEWMQRLTAPTVVAPGSAVGTPFRTAVPNNDADVWAAPISKGKEPKKELVELKSMKSVRPVHIRPQNPNEAALHYLFPLSGDPEGPAKLEAHLPVLRAAASGVTHLGWGVDHAVGEASALSAAEAEALVGDRWRPVAAGGTPLRVPVEGTLDDLARRHGEFLGRLDGGGFRPVPPLGRFAVVGYHSATAAPAGGTVAPARPFAAFELHRTVGELLARPAGSRFRPFAATRAHAVAGMVRHAVAQAAGAMGMSPDRIDSFVLGHGAEKDGQSTSDDRLTFLPLPSVTPRGIESIRRVLVVGPPGFDLAPLARRLNGAELIEAGKGPAAALAFAPPGDRNLEHYVGESAVWSTVTPLVLPGHDDPDGLRRKLRGREEAGTATAAHQRDTLERLDARAVKLVRRSLAEAGCAPELAASAAIVYRPTGFRPGVELAVRYGSTLRYPRFHVRVRFGCPMRGPLSAGAGRYRGLGLFARESP